MYVFFFSEVRVGFCRTDFSLIFVFEPPILSLDFFSHFGEGQKGTPGRGRDRKCHDRASLSRPLVLSLEPLTP